MSIKIFVSRFGWPRLLIASFLLLLFAAAPLVDVRIDSSISDTINRFGMNGMMTLAMIPMIHSGCGLNFGLPLGIIAGLLGAVLTIELGLTGFSAFITAVLLATPFAVLFGLAYGRLLNRVKGSEMMIATYIGFSTVAFFCMVWLLIPLDNPVMIWGYGGSGLRTTITVEGYYLHILNDFFSIPLTENLVIPTGMLLVFGLFSGLLHVFLRTKTGMAMTAVGSNPEFARASGIKIDRMRILSVTLSTWLGAIGILVYQQSFGFIQLYMGPLYLAFPAVAAILIGGASITKATISHAVAGTLLFQGILTMTPSVMNSFIHTDVSEVIRIVLSNGMILYALTRPMRRRNS